MSRFRPTRIGRWLRAGAVGVAYLVLTCTLFVLEFGDFGVAPLWAILGVPPVFYAVMSRFAMRRVSLQRRMSWIGGACVTHVVLSITAAVAFASLSDMTPMSTLAIVFAHVSVAPVLTLIATPLALAPFRGRVLVARPAPRADRASRQAVFLPPVPSAGETVFAREARRRDGAPEPAASAPAPVDSQPAPPAQDDAIIRVRFERIADQLPADAFTLPMERIAESLREPHWLTVPRRVVVSMLPEGAVMLDWALVASQFPPLAFAVSDIEFRQKYPDLKITLPMDDVLGQLPRGVFGVTAGSNHIAGLDAFPAPFQPLARPRDAAPAAAPAAAATADAPDLPPGIVAVETPVAVAPAPVVRPAPVIAPAPVVAPPPAPVVAASAPVPPPPAIAPPAPIVPPAPAAPAPVPPPPSAPVAKMPPPVVKTPPPVVKTPPPVVKTPPPVAKTPPPVAKTPPPAKTPAPKAAPARAAVPPPPAKPREVPAAKPREVIDREVLAKLAACFAGAGTFEAWAGLVDDAPLVAFLAPSLSRDGVTTVAARLATLLGAAAGEQVTVRTARAAIVVAAAPTPVVVAARRPGAPVALMELRAARAAALVGKPADKAAPSSRALSSLAVDARVAGIAEGLGAFGGVEPAVLTDSVKGARVYVFREPGREADHVGTLALAAWEALGRTGDADLGPLVSIVFRQGRRRTLVRPIGGGSALTLLAADGTVTQPGRAWREADRAAAALEAR